MRKKITFYKDWEQMPLALTVSEVAAILHTSEQSIRKHARAGTLPANKFGKSWRFDRTVIQQVVEGGKTA